MSFDHFYSDPHFGHKNIIEYCGRPFIDVEHMNYNMIGLFNAHVQCTHTTLWLGDCFFMKDDEAKNILSRMNGKHYLIKGNHDKNARRMADIGFQWVTTDLSFRMAGLCFRANHFPWPDEKADERFPEKHLRRRPHQVLLHGHTHSTKRTGRMSIHCGVDAWGYRPVSRSEILDLVEEL